MGDIIFPSQTPTMPQEKSLKLRPIEQLEKIMEKNHGNQKKVKMEFFEIQGPTKENHIGDLIYPLLEIGITKAKVYATKVSGEAIRQVVVITPIVTQTLWDRLKAYLTWFKQDAIKEDDSQKFTITEDGEYIIIHALDQEGTEKREKREIPNNYEVISTSMLESSYVLFNAQNLKSVNQLKNVGENNQSNPVPIDICESFIIADSGTYKNSFGFSDPGSVVYAPEATSSSFRALNCLAAEFELVGNKIIVNELASIPEDFQAEIGKLVEAPSVA